jgi:alanyl aminopeptidase
MRSATLLRFAAFCAACTFGAPLLAADAASLAVPSGKLPDTLQAEAFAIELRIDPRNEDFAGVSRIDGALKQATRTVFVHGRDMQISRATITPNGGESLSLSAKQVHVSGVIELTAAADIPAGPATLVLEYTAPFNRQLEGAYKLVHAGESYVMTQMEPLGARLAFPGMDEPAFKRPWDITLIVPQDQNAVANTRLVEETKLADGFKRMRFARTENLPSYLIAFAVGPWDIVEWNDIPANAVRKTPLALRGVAAKGRGKDMRYALEHTAEIVNELERYFGIAYPFDKLDILAAPDFAAGAMENAGLITYRDSLMFANDRSPTGLRQAYWGVHAHELAHQWFGDLVTMPWWDDLWLNEAFATWMATRTIRAIKPEFGGERGKLEGTLAAMSGDSLATTRRVREPIDDFTEIAAAFDGITYQKGGAVLAMFEHFIGTENFRAGIHQYLVDHARGNATSRDLIAAVAAQSDDPEGVFAAFSSFVDQPGVPFLRVALHCDAGKAPTVDIAQSRYLPLGSSAASGQHWGVPLCLRFGTGDNAQTQCRLITETQSRVALDSASCPDWLMPNADAAGYYRFALAAADQQRLDRAFNRLSDTEQRVVADSLAAAFEAGAIDAAAYLSALPKLAGAKARQVVTAPIDTLTWMDEHLARNDTERAALHARVRAVYQPRLDALGLDAKPGESDDDHLLRAALQSLLADFARDPALRASLGTRGRAVLGIDGDGVLKPDAVAPDQRALALAMAATSGDGALFDAMTKAFRASTDSVLRGQLLSALGRFTDPALAARARAISLEDGTRSNELTIVAFSQLGERESRADARQWLRSEYDALMKKGPRGLGGGFVRLDAFARCSDANADAISAWHEPRLREVEGGPRRLAQSIEGIRLCAALKAGQQPAGLGL